ncbi:hypothetical protein B5U98_16695 [Bosea sp. Tri-39]|nr:hypothetical protein BLM15_06040 [Bosea sp. Tri-49]RXT22068.1 hypothetical protein B5U98_16695 [Bosea sp. Tri-39]RXT32410.1 hypothetical protein B5U99_27540 [Bosea sp. Tri-54]
MEYHREVLDRDTGQLETQSIGDWITVTELGHHYCVGKREVRAILNHIGVLALEGQRYRLPRHMVDQGIGRRHDFPKSGHAFDVLSPLGQQLVATVWDDTLSDYRAERDKEGLVACIREALMTFKARRNDDLGTAGEVRFVLDHFRDVQLNTVAAALDVSPQLVSRHAARRGAQMAFAKRWRARELPADKQAVSSITAESADFPDWSSQSAEAMGDPSILPNRSTPPKMIVAGAVAPETVFHAA